MFEYIKGLYMGMGKDYIIIENGGIGYKIFTSGSTMAEMPKIGDEVLIYIQQIVREDFIGLYGFLTREELDMFNLLLTINGVGAKATLSLLSISNVESLKYSIYSGDEKNITKAPGIGKKIAQRIILELKDKIKITSINVENLEELTSSLDEDNVKEALEALIALGYTEREAKKALENIDKSASLETIIKQSLRLLMK